MDVFRYHSFFFIPSIFRQAVILPILFLICSGSLLAQSSVLGRFEVNYIAGCSPLKVVITETDTFSTETVRQYDFEGDGDFVGFEPTEEVSFTYQEPGSYSIVQVINVDIVPKTDTIYLEVYPGTDPDFTILTCENHGAIIDIEPGQYEQYRIFYTSSDSLTLDSGEEVPPYNYTPGNHTISVKGLFFNGKDNCGVRSRDFTTIENLIPASLNELRLIKRDPAEGAVQLSYTLSPDVVYRLEMAENFPSGFEVVEDLPGNSSVFTHGPIDTENSLPIYRISAYDACAEKSVQSNTLSVIRIEAIAENNRNRITWEVYPTGFDQFEVIKDNQPEAVIDAENRREYIDNDVTCLTEYCYTMVYSQTNGAKSYADTACVEAVSIYFPPAIRNTTVSVEDEEADLGWIPPESVDPVSYFIQKRLDEDVYSTLDTVLQTQFRDVEANAASGSVCYRVSYLDECRNRSNLGDLACTVFLDLGEDQSLSWNDYSGWRNGVSHYILEAFLEDGTLLEEINMGTTNFYEITDFNDFQKVWFRIRAESNDDPAFMAYSNTVVRELEPGLWMPNAFTPNGDGLNDFYKPEGTPMVEFSMKIYNRNGHLLYETEDQDTGWDGLYDGEEMPFNTYIYIIEAVDDRGKTHNKTGKLLLMRE